MSDYKHRMTIVVPKSLMAAANQLALIAGESLDDVHTFTNADWQGADGNLYAVCSTVIKPIVLAMLGKPVEESGLTGEGADNDLANTAMSKAVLYSEGMTINNEQIVIGVDIEPLGMFDALGLIMTGDDIT